MPQGAAFNAGMMPGNRIEVASLAQADRMDEARAALQRIKETHPASRLRGLSKTFPIRRGRWPNSSLACARPAWNNMQCPLMALSGHRHVRCTCLLLTQSGHQSVDSYVSARRGAAELGSCLTDATRARVAPGEPFACLPLCCGPNGLRSNHRCLLTRVELSNLLCQKGCPEILDQVS